MTTFVCQCGSDTFVRVERFYTDGRVRPFEHGRDGGNKPLIRCSKCNTGYQFEVETKTWDEVK